MYSFWSLFISDYILPFKLIVYSVIALYLVEIQEHENTNIH